MPKSTQKHKTGSLAQASWRWRHMEVEMDKWMDDSQLDLGAGVMAMQTRGYPNCYHEEEFRSQRPCGDTT